MTTNKLYNGLLGKPTYEELVRENERLRIRLAQIAGHVCALNSDMMGKCFVCGYQSKT